MAKNTVDTSKTDFAQHCRIQRLLGEGKTAKAWMYQTPDEEERTVAVKQIDKWRIKSTLELKLLDREVDSVKRLVHTHIVRVEALFVDTTIFIVMEHVNKGRCPTRRPGECWMNQSMKYSGVCLRQ